MKRFIMKKLGFQGKWSFIKLIFIFSVSRVPVDTGINTRSGSDKRSASEAFGEQSSSKKRKGTTEGKQIFKFILIAQSQKFKIVVPFIKSGFIYLFKFNYKSTIFSKYF